MGCIRCGLRWRHALSRGGLGDVCSVRGRDYRLGKNRLRNNRIRLNLRWSESSLRGYRNRLGGFGKARCVVGVECADRYRNFYIFCVCAGEFGVVVLP